MELLEFIFMIHNKIIFIFIQFMSFTITNYVFLRFWVFKITLVESSKEKLSKFANPWLKAKNSVGVGGALRRTIRYSKWNCDKHDGLWREYNVSLTFWQLLTSVSEKANDPDLFRCKYLPPCLLALLDGKLLERPILEINSYRSYELYDCIEFLAIFIVIQLTSFCLIHGIFMELSFLFMEVSWKYKFIFIDIDGISISYSWIFMIFRQNSYDLYDPYEPNFFMSCMNFKLW